MKRFIVDSVGNYIFFVPLVGLLAGQVIPRVTGAPTWDWNIFQSYAVSSLAIAPLSGRRFTIVLEKVWYPLCKENF